MRITAYRFSLPNGANVQSLGNPFAVQVTSTATIKPQDLKVLLFPLVAVCVLIKWLGILLMTCGAYVLSPLMLFIFACGIYTVFKQQWNQTLILAVLELGCIALITGAAWIAGLAESAALTLTGF